MNPMDLKRGVDMAVELLLLAMSRSKKISTSDEVAQVGTISQMAKKKSGR